MWVLWTAAISLEVEIFYILCNLVHIQRGLSLKCREMTPAPHGSIAYPPRPPQLSYNAGAEANTFDVLGRSLGPGAQVWVWLGGDPGSGPMADPPRALQEPYNVQR